MGSQAFVNVGLPAVTDVNFFFVEDFYIQFFSKIAPNFIMAGGLQLPDH